MDHHEGGCVCSGVRFAERQPFRHVFVRSRRAWSDLSPLVETYEQHFRP